MTRGSADGSVLPIHLLLQHRLGVVISADLLVGEEGQHPLLKGAEATLDLAFGLRTWGDEMVHAQGCERPLELRSGIPAIAGGLMPEKGEPVGVDGLRTAVAKERPTKVLKMGPGGVRGHEGGGDAPSGVVVDGE